MFDRLFKRDTASSLSLSQEENQAPSGRDAISKSFYDKGMRRAKKAKAKKKIVQKCDDNVNTRLASTFNTASVGANATRYGEVKRESINDVLSEEIRIKEEGPSQSEIRRSA